MPRPQKKRSVRQPPLFSSFKPMRVRANQLQALPLALDEFEAIRLADYEGLDHAESAERMDVSRSTFSRLVERARLKVARFLVEGGLLEIGGGEIHFKGNLMRCDPCGHLFNVPFDMEPTGCPSCGSPDLIDLAGGFGHGHCCRRHHRPNGR